MKSLSELLSSMASYMFGLSLTTSVQNGQSEKAPLTQSPSHCTQHFTQSNPESRFTDSMDSFLILLNSKVQTELEIVRIQKDIAEANLIIAQNHNRPHRIFGPTLRHDGLEWICSYGMDDDGKPLLVGRGENPNDALTDFDFKWLGITEE